MLKLLGAMLILLAGTLLGFIRHPNYRAGLSKSPS